MAGSSFFNQYPHLEGTHSFLSASQYSWVNYDVDKLVERWNTVRASSHGTRLHELAAELIRLGQKLPRANKTLNLYVNDAIGYRMSPEVVLLASGNAYGTADAIRFDPPVGNTRAKLRVHDLKTGVTKASWLQLIIYCAFFCIEYGYRPGDLDIELRIYQNDEVAILIPDVGDIVQVISQFELFNPIIEDLKMKEIM